MVAIQNLVGNAVEVIWGFLTPFVRRSYVLAFGNVVLTNAVGLPDLFVVRYDSA
jgi:hypothetical protein